MTALYFIVDTLTTLYLAVLLLRLIMQLVRVDFRNPFAEAVVRLTNPLVMPLRRVLPPVGKVDSASVLAIVLFAAFKAAVLWLVMTRTVPGPITWIVETVFVLVLGVLWLYVIMVLFYGIAGMLLQGRGSPIYDVLADLCEPLLSRIRRTIPSLVGGLDLSFLWAIIGLQALILLIKEFFR
jgi:YggT family protein